MFMKNDRSLNLATTLQANGAAVPAWLGGGAWVDAPNTLWWVTPDQRGRRVGPYGFDLAKLRRILRDEYGVMRFTFVMGYKQGAERARLREAVLTAGWRYWEARKANFGWNADPTDDYLLDALVRELDRDVPGTIVLVAHDHGYGWILRHALELGWRVVVIGCIDKMSGQLTGLSHPHYEVLDLRDMGVLPRSYAEVMRPMASEPSRKPTPGSLPA